MTDESDAAEYERLMTALDEADNEDTRAIAREAFGNFHNLRAVERDIEEVSFAATLGGEPPEPATAVVDGPTLERPPAHCDVGAGILTLPDGRRMQRLKIPDDLSELVDPPDDDPSAA